VLVGRALERQAIERALATARCGSSSRLALVGEPGIGKTALMDYGAQEAQGMRILRARGIESEAQIPFASLFELLRPALAMVEQIPPPQAVALEGALALRPAQTQERFAVGAATLSLLAAYAEQEPLAVLVDDAQWLDASSAQALLFAVRRLHADPITVLLSARDDEPSLLDGADLPTLRLSGLSTEESQELLRDLPAELGRRLHEATGGNPLGLIELARESDQLELAPTGAPVLVPARIAHAFLRRAGTLEEPVRRALVLAATSDSPDLGTLKRAAQRFKLDLSALAGAQDVGLIRLRGGAVEFRHPLARSAIYAQAPAEERRQAHRAMAAALPDRDIDRRAWHLASAAVGVDETASEALSQAGARGRERSAYATAAAAFERAARLAGDRERAAHLLWEAADAAWLAGLGDRAVRLLDRARALTDDLGRQVGIDQLAGHIATRRGPVMSGYAILTEAAERADPERAVMMLTEAAAACFAAGKPREMLSASARAQELLPEQASPRARYVTAIAGGMAHTLGGDAEAGAELIHAAVALAEGSPALPEDPQLLPWLVLAPLFLRERRAGRALIAQALEAARARAAVGALPFLLNLVARDQATTDRWSVAEATLVETIALARETGQRTELAFALANHALLAARRGRDPECRASAGEALALAEELGLALYEIWTVAALGELELGLGQPDTAARHFEREQHLIERLEITDPDVTPAAELVEAYLRLERREEAVAVADAFEVTARAKGQPWSLARALRCRAMLAGDSDYGAVFEQALALHDGTPDAFQVARTRLVYGERLRRGRQRVRAREQLRAALEVFERLDAKPWAERARSELAASGERLRRRDPSTLDDLTPQELQIGLLLAAGKTTREAAAALFLSPKTVEYHLRHVYLKLGIGSRAELARALADRPQPNEEGRDRGKEGRDRGEEGRDRGEEGSGAVSAGQPGSAPAAEPVR
jgi:DNA-binding CsgD family transcriptional regulator/tetratricopeptide (TPR) repeat protein